MMTKTDGVETDRKEKTTTTAWESDVASVVACLTMSHPRRLIESACFDLFCCCYFALRLFSSALHFCSVSQKGEKGEGA